MEDVTSKMQERQMVLKGEFEGLTKEAQTLIDQGKIINKRLSEIAARKGQIQGAYSEITELLGKPEKIGEPKKPKKK